MRVSKMVKVLAVACLAVLPLQGVAHAVIPPQHAAGSDGHDFEYTGEYRTDLTHRYRDGANKFTGTLSSNFLDPAGLLEDAADLATVCVKGREVKVYKVRSEGSDALVGSDKTDASGAWSVVKDVRRGKFYASVSKDEILIREYYEGIDFYAVCKSATSETKSL